MNRKLQFVIYHNGRWCDQNEVMRLKDLSTEKRRTFEKERERESHGLLDHKFIWTLVTTITFQQNRKYVIIKHIKNPLNILFITFL
jgi:hypothetical protein